MAPNPQISCTMRLFFVTENTIAYRIFAICLFVLYLFVYLFICLFVYLFMYN